MGRCEIRDTQTLGVKRQVVKKPLSTNFIRHDLLRSTINPLTTQLWTIKHLTHITCSYAHPLGQLLINLLHKLSDRSITCWRRAGFRMPLTAKGLCVCYDKWARSKVMSRQKDYWFDWVCVYLRGWCGSSVNVREDIPLMGGLLYSIQFQ